MSDFFKIIVEKLITKKKVIGWVGAALIAITAAAASIDQKEVRDAVCGVESK